MHLVGGAACVSALTPALPSLLSRAALTPAEEAVELTESEAQIKKKLRSAFCEEVMEKMLNKRR